MKGFIIALFLIVSASLAFAQDVAPTVSVVAVTASTASVAIPTISADGNIGDIIKLGVDLVKNAKTIGIWGILSFVVVILLSLLNNGLITSIKGFTNEYKYFCNVALSTLLSIFSAIYLGGNWITVVNSVLFISGGATLVYRAGASAGIFKKKVKN